VANPNQDEDQKAEENNNARHGALSTGSSQAMVVGLVISGSSFPLSRE